VGHHRRYDPSYIEAYRKIREGYIGTPISVRNDNRDYYFNPDFFRRFSPKSGGTILDTGSHDYDMIRWLLDTEAKSIYGLGGAYVYDFLDEFNDVDNASLLMEFGNGMMEQFSGRRLFIPIVRFPNPVYRYFKRPSEFLRMACTHMQETT
jgi:myo-inositol 2-dehydrogenase/D-chiro-inositol 1-dehydrogenase